jgi:hypothetical protein
MITTTKQLDRTTDRAALAGRLRCHLVFLAPDEWGTRLMEEVARAALAERPHVDAVQVHEHGGWSLTFARGVNGELLTVGSANTSAVYDGAARLWRDSARGRGVEYVGHERRGG